MAGHRGRARTGWFAVGVAVLVVALSACNPLVNQTTSGYEGYPPWIPPSSDSGQFDFVSSESGWLEVQVTDVVSPEVVMSGFYRYPDTSACGHFPGALVWSGGASTGFQRLAWIDPGAQFVFTGSGSDPIRFNVRVVNDATEPVGDVVPYVTPEGELPSVGWPICGP